MTAIYPQLSVLTFDRRILVQTNVRKKDKDGVYRLVHIEEYLICGEDDGDEMVHAAINNVNRMAKRAFKEEEVSGMVYSEGAAKGCAKYPICNSYLGLDGRQLGEYGRFDITKRLERVKV